MIQTRLYRHARLEREDFPPELVSDYLKDPSSVVWLDAVDPPPGEMDLLAEEFALHPLAVEDAVHSHQRPKLDRYPGHLFLVLYAARNDPSRLSTSEIDLFLQHQFIITVRKDSSWPVDHVLKRWEEGGGLAKHGVAFLVHGLLDAVVDEYVAIANELQEELDDLEEMVEEPTGKGTFEDQLFSLRKKLVAFRRVVLPTKEAVARLGEDKFLALDEDLVPYFADITDHLARTSESIDAMLDLLQGTLNLFLSMASNRLNDVMRKVTSWAAIIGVATTIAGIYGMNFKLWPNGDNPYSFWIALGMIFAASLTLFIYFRKREWL